MGDDKEKYYNVSDAWDEVVFEDETKGKLLAGAKLLGKLGFNTLRFAGEVGWEVIKSAPTEFPKQIIRNYERMLDRDDLTDTQRMQIESKIQEIKEKYGDKEPE